MEESELIAKIRAELLRFQALKIPVEEIVLEIMTHINKYVDLSESK